MTAHVVIGDRERCLSAGMTEYNSKPFEPEELESKLAPLRNTPPGCGRSTYNKTWH